MQKIAPHLWFDKEAKEAAALYTSLFENSRIKTTTTLRDTPSGNADLVALDLAGQDFRFISAGPFFKFTPAISFLVVCRTKEEVDRLWRELSPGGTVRMDLGSYPFSDRYGWTDDRFGVPWQIMLAARPVDQKITPVLMFTGKNNGKAEEAVQFYTSVFPQSNDPGGVPEFHPFTLAGGRFAAMDGGTQHAFTFNEAVSLMVHCDSQAEVDRYWSALSADPKAEQCGWLKDKYGVSWQVVPTAMDRMLATKDDRKIARVTQAFLKMKKFDIATLEKAFAG